VDLFHFLIVFVPTFVAFALAGMIMFGRQVEGFSTPQASLFNCFKIAMESEYRWQELSEKDWFSSFAWVVSFMIGIVLLMMNMILAIIMDVYQEVRQLAGDSMTMFVHVKYIGMRILYFKKFVGDFELFARIQEMPRTITRLEFDTAFPEMSEYQREFLLSAVKNKAQAINRQGVSQTISAQIVAAIVIGLKQVQSDLKDMRAKGWLGKGMAVGSDTERIFVKDILTSVAVQTHWISMASKQLAQVQRKLDYEQKGRALLEGRMAKRSTRKNTGQLKTSIRISSAAGVQHD